MSCFLRPAIAMIELIFAIVIIGIVMMSAPELLSRASHNSYITIQQESINEASTQMSIMLDYAWDENDTFHTTVLNVTHGDSTLNATKMPQKRRAGTPLLSHRVYKSFDGLEFQASHIGLDTGEAFENIDDIDDFNGTLVHLTLIDTPTPKDYILKGTQINLLSTVTYMDDHAEDYHTGGGGTLTYRPTFNAVSPSTNIKHLQVTLTSTSDAQLLDTNITLHAFSCNIGTYSLEEKE